MLGHILNNFFHIFTPSLFFSVRRLKIESQILDEREETGFNRDDMPEITGTTEPPLYGFLNATDNPYGGSLAWLTDKARKPGEIERYITKLENTAISHQPARAREVGAVMDLLFAPFRPDIIVTDTDIREYSGRLQHQLADHFTYALSESAEPNFVQSMVQVAQFLQGVGRVGSDAGRSIEAGKFWSGARSEAFLTHFLLERGFRVFLPSYTNSQTDEWDYKAGVDMLIQHPQGGRLRLVDVTGFMDTQQIVPDTRNYPVEQLPLTLRGQLQSLGYNVKDYLPFTTLELPTHDSMWGEGPTPQTGREVLAQALTLSTGFHDDILKALPEIQT